MKRVLRVLEYSADSVEAIEDILKHIVLRDGGVRDNTNPINGTLIGLGGGSIVATCNVMDIPFIDGKFRLIRMLDYRSKGSENRDGFSITGLKVIYDCLSTSSIPMNGEKTISQNGFEVVIRSGIIGDGFGED